MIYYFVCLGSYSGWEKNNHYKVMVPQYCVAWIRAEGVSFAFSLILPCPTWGHVFALDVFLECTSFSTWGTAVIRWWSIVPCPFLHSHQVCSSAVLLGLPHALSLLQPPSGIYPLISEIQQQSSCQSLCLNFPISSASGT